MRHEMIQAQNILKVRAALRRATEYLAERRNLSLKGARKWIYQEARAKKASLAEVARAVITEQPIHYQHALPNLGSLPPLVTSARWQSENDLKDSLLDRAYRPAISVAHGKN